MTRVGIGRDLHPLVAGRRFLLGGVEIPADFGESAHSDGDALCHAIIDALLGAAGLGDIGEFFPPSSARWKDSDSLELLKISAEALYKAGWKIVNIDSVVSCERPAVLPYRQQIRDSLSGVLGISPDAVFVKGKSGEKIGAIGQGKAVEALAVCLVEKMEKF
jgi:2-C-methyl-D-erythritol 2,4-cyclodiphosphate synthase/2-C-methyl-D-erythritol 4-phosphate cytidylyltransferase/2-C-methyl-D-erythritol 2,4-cyclodiphosphate synthase